LVVVPSSLEVSRIWPLRYTRADIPDSKADIPKIKIPGPSGQFRLWTKMPSSHTKNITSRYAVVPCGRRRSLAER